MKKNSDQRSAISYQHIKAKAKSKSRGLSSVGVVIFFVIIGLLLFAQSSILIAANDPAKQEEKKAKAEDKTVKADAKSEVKTEEKKRTELTEKEDSLKKEEERLKILKKELDEKIDRYTKLLARMEEVLKSVDTAKGEQYQHLVKAYEAMPNEEAAARLAELDEQTAIKILVRIKSKKAGAVLGVMEPKKAAALTEGMMGMVKKVPTK